MGLFEERYKRKTFK